jgi:hypothetical protein
LRPGTRKELDRFCGSLAWPAPIPSPIPILSPILPAWPRRGQSTTFLRTFRVIDRNRNLVHHVGLLQGNRGLREKVPLMRSGGIRTEVALAIGHRLRHEYDAQQLIPLPARLRRLLEVLEAGEQPIGHVQAETPLCADSGLRDAPGAFPQSSDVERPPSPISSSEAL